MIVTPHMKITHSPFMHRTSSKDEVIDTTVTLCRCVMVGRSPVFTSSNCRCSNVIVCDNGKSNRRRSFWKAPSGKGCGSITLVLKLAEETCRLPTKAVPDADLRTGPHLVLAKRHRQVPNWGRCHDVGRVLIAFVTWSAWRNALIEQFFVHVSERNLICCLLGHIVIH